MTEKQKVYSPDELATMKAEFYAGVVVTEMALLPIEADKLREWFARVNKVDHSPAE